MPTNTGSEIQKSSIMAGGGGKARSFFLVQRIEWVSGRFVRSGQGLLHAFWEVRCSVKLYACELIK